MTVASTGSATGALMSVLRKRLIRRQNANRLTICENESSVLPVAEFIEATGLLKYFYIYLMGAIPV